MTTSFHQSLFQLIILVNYLISITYQANPDGAMLTRFRNLANYDIVLWWLTPYEDEEIRFFGHLKANGGMTSFTSYVGHRFFWAPPNKQHDTSQRRGFFRIQRDQILYVYTDDNDPGDASLVREANEELSFLKEYYQTYNRHWLSTYQRPAPEVPFIIMNADNTKTKWTTSTAYHWICNPESTINNQEPPRNNNRGSRLSRIMSSSRSSSNTINTQCQDKNGGIPLRFMIEQLYPADPRIYKVSNFINEYEAKHLIDISKHKMQRSTVGDGKNRRQDPTRTCSNTWLSMNRTKVVETLYYRIGDILGIDQFKMSVKASVMDEATGTVEGVASHMEVIHFGTGEHYSRHYDNAVNDEIYLHIITFQVILSTSDDFSGGATNFPHAGGIGRKGKDQDMNRGLNIGFNVESEKYSAVFWYNLLQDGNLDETSMYSNTRVDAGEQWMFHVSIWDPTLPIHGDPKMPHNVIYADHDEL